MRGGLNTYTYVLNNPLYWIDPKGLINLQIPGTSGETTVHANPGPDVVPPGARVEHDPPHVHLGNNNGPRISTETFEPLTPDDARIMTGKQKKFCKKLTGAQKAMIKLRQLNVFKHGKTILMLMATPAITLDSLTAACKTDPFFCIEQFPAVLDSFKERCGEKCGE